MLLRPPTSTLFPYTTLFRSSDIGFGNRVFAMIGANMTIDVKEAEHVAMFSDTLLRDLLTECVAAFACRQLGQLAARKGSHALGQEIDRKSTRLNSSHLGISYAGFCLKKKMRLCHPLS